MLKNLIINRLSQKRKKVRAKKEKRKLPTLMMLKRLMMS